MSLAQETTPAAAPTPHKALPPIRANKALGPGDDFAGLHYTDDQKAQIRKIREDFKARMDAVAKSDKLSPEQKGAMLQGYAHMERGEVYKVLSPDQQMEVRKRTLARRAEARKLGEEKQQPLERLPAPLQPPQSPPSAQAPQSPHP